VTPAGNDAPIKIRLRHLTKRFRTRDGGFTAIDDV
jgi:hypothetical protein